VATSVWLFEPRSHGRKRKATRARNGAPLPGRHPGFHHIPHRSASRRLRLVIEESAMAVRIPDADLGQLDPKIHAASNLAAPQRDGEFKILFIYSLVPVWGGFVQLTTPESPSCWEAPRAVSNKPTLQFRVARPSSRVRIAFPRT
jgi:hypothetical protein